MDAIKLGEEFAGLHMDEENAGITMPDAACVAARIGDTSPDCMPYFPSKVVVVNCDLGI